MPARKPPLSELRKRLLRWYRATSRALPWRLTRNPYRILVSEVMLQQTRVSRVLEKYRQFLKQFPNLPALANATPAEVIVAWRGMGYNNRAIRLQSLARVVRNEHGGRLPADPQRLIQLPGIGRYTANAVACFAFEQRVPLVDTNINRVLTRVFPHSGNNSWDIAARILPKRAYDWNQALMELGALVCLAVNPKCGKCPLAALCPGAYGRYPRTQVIRRAEPGRKGVPNRIYRGRIVEELRNRNGVPTPLSKLGVRIMPGFAKRDTAWLTGVLKALEKDGVVRSVKSGEGRSVVLAS